MAARKGFALMTFGQQLIISVLTVLASGVVSGVISYVVASTIQKQKQKYLEEKERRDQQAKEEEQRKLRAPNDIQKDILRLCFEIGEKRLSCEFHSGGAYINGREVTTQSGEPYVGSVIETQLRELQLKGHVEILHETEYHTTFELRRSDNPISE
jgi:hypothetical protein